MNDPDGDEGRYRQDSHYDRGRWSDDDIGDENDHSSQCHAQQQQSRQCGSVGGRHEVNNARRRNNNRCMATGDVTRIVALIEATIVTM